MDLTPLYDYHISATADLPRQFSRYLMDQIDWRERSILITGLRGVGKTVLVQQAADQIGLKPISEYLYLSADHFLVLKNGLYNYVAQYFNHENGKLVLIDELQKYADWQVEWKNILDGFSHKQVIATGSSSLLLKETDTDLKRRRAHYSLPIMSFREYLKFQYQIEMATVSLQALLEDHVQIALELKSKAESQDRSVFKLFKEYLEFGAYPFISAGQSRFKTKLLETADAVMENDIRQLFDLKTEGTAKLKILFAIIAGSEPFSPNIEGLARDLQLSRPTVEKYLTYLHKADLIQLLTKKQRKAGKLATQVKKVVISNCNLQMAYSDNLPLLVSKGSLRETFFVAATKHLDPYVATYGDYEIDGHNFEIGGKNKTRRQLKEDATAWVVKDDIIIGDNRTLPLYLFGLLY